MSRYCGVCGASLGMTSLTTGRCEQCNARVETSGSSMDERDLAISDAPTLVGRGSDGDPADTHTSSQALPGPGREFTPKVRPMTPAPSIEEHRHSRRESPRVPLIWVISLLLVVALLLTTGALLLLAHTGGIVIAPFTSSNANANSSSNSNSGIPGGRTTATSGGTGQGQGGSGGPGSGKGTPTRTSSGTATPSRSGTPTGGVGGPPTSTPTPPVLSVSPTNPPELVCPASVPITISNTGQAPLVWSASTGSGYTVSPAGGTVDGGDNASATINVTIHLLTTVTVTITAAGAENSPQTVTISCIL